MSRVVSLNWDLHELNGAVQRLEQFAKRKATTIFRTSVHSGAMKLRTKARKLPMMKKISQVPGKKGQASLIVEAVRWNRLPTHQAESRVYLNRGWNGYLVRFQEFGYRTVTTGRYSKSIKKRWKKETRPEVKGHSKAQRRTISKVPAKGFLRAMWDAEQDDLIGNVGNRFSRLVAKEWKRLGR
jgi:hypothetical protein